MAKRLAVVLASMLTASGFGMLALAAPAGAQVPGGTFSASSSGAAVHTDAALVGGPRLVDVEQAFSGESASSASLANGLRNELDVVVQPALPDKNAYGQGSGLQIGLGSTPPVSPGANQLILGGLAEATAVPSTPLVTKEVGPIAVNPLAYVSLLRGQAQAAFNPNSCVIGKPLGFGFGNATQSQLLDLGTASPDGRLGAPLVATDTVQGDTVSHSTSYSYLTPNGDGTFGLVSLTRQHIAPVTLFKGNANQLTIEVLGEWILRVTATGKPGGAKVEYAPVGNPTPTTPILSINDQGTGAQTLTFQQVFGNSGFSLPANPLVDLAIAEAPRAIAGAFASAPAVNPDGTSASAAVDIVRARLLPAAATTGVSALDVRVGHMEASAVVPPGGIRCNIPVNKTTNPNPVAAGQQFTWTISIPSSADALKDVDCDLVNVRAVDTVRVLTGRVTYRLLSASNGGRITGNNNVTWDNLGNYRPGDPPIVVTIVGVVTGGSGTIENKVDVAAITANCRGGAAGQQLVGEARITGAALTGSVTVQGPRSGASVLGAQLPATGAPARLAVFGTALLAGAFGLRRLRLATGARGSRDG